MICPTCNRRLQFGKHSKAVDGVTVFTCPDCDTAFDFLLEQKMAPKGIAILTASMLFFSYFLDLVAILPVGGIALYLLWRYMQPVNIRQVNNNVANSG